jgi:hypothetical protein
MKRKINFIILMFIVAHSSFAQSFDLGIKGGSDIQKIQGASFSDKFTFGYHFGLFSSLKLSKKLSVQPEVYYSAVEMDTGANFSTVYNSVGISKLKFGYYNIPVLLNIKPNDHYSIQLGPNYKILNDRNLSLVGNGKKAIKAGDFSILAGVQLYFSSFRIYGRYQIGLTNVNDVGDQAKWKSQTIHIGVALKII